MKTISHYTIQISTGAKATLKNNAPKLCNVARGSKANIFIVTSQIFNKSVSAATEYVLICLILRSDQKIDASAWCHVVYTITWCHVPREHGSRDALTKPGNIVYFCTSRDARWTNHDRVIQIVITLCPVQSQNLLVKIWQTPLCLWLYFVCADACLLCYFTVVMFVNVKRGP